MINWTQMTNDPLDSSVRTQVLNYLKDIRSPLPGNNYNQYLADTCHGKRVLDIGVCEHTQERMASKGWKHRIVVENAEYCLGLDIDKPLTNELKAAGYNVVCCDATSDTDLGERFDVIHIGDVIEHVDSPVKLIEFAVRHLRENGIILVRTPAAYCFGYVDLIYKNTTDLSNLEHMYYVLPIHMIEISRRAGVEMNCYRTLTRSGLTRSGIVAALGHIKNFKFRHAWAELFAPPEIYTTIYVYELSKTKESVI
jgi:2-polyprenyl-3-methyl-5-hydroxy-6-metoxy-1,4-benzoquinol methylase